MYRLTTLLKTPKKKKYQLISFYKTHDSLGMGSKFYANFQCDILWPRATCSFWHGLLRGCSVSWLSLYHWVNKTLFLNIHDGLALECDLWNFLYLINSISFCNKTFNLLMFDSRKIIVLSWLIERRFSNIHNDLPFEDCYLIDLFLFCSLTTWCCLVMKCSISWSLISELSLVILSMSPMAELLCNPIDFLFLVYLMSSCI